jgi:protein-tyrosine-phosphatase
MKKILFVCRANVCRSPMAEAILNTLAGDADLDLRAESAGVRALEGMGIDPGARAVLEEMGIVPGEHRARQVAGPLIEEADLVLTMNRRQRAYILEGSGGSEEKVRILADYSGGAHGQTGIADPHGQSAQAYRATAREILQCIDSLLEHATRGASSPS